MIQSISLAGAADTPNDDRAGSATAHAWVIDGATDLGPPGLVGRQGGAAWLAGQAHAAFMAVADAPLAAMCGAVAEVLANDYASARTRDPYGRWELPIAAFLAVRLDGDALECGWLGDCVGLLRGDSGVTRIGPLPADRDAEAAHAASLAEYGLGAVKQAEAPIIDSLRAARDRPGRSVLGVEPATLTRLETARINCTPGDDLLLMTDGFAALIDSYAALDATSLMAALIQDGLPALAIALRAIEATDSACTRYPRFKRSDDATAIWLRVAA
ncbi:hypothetical protein ACX40Y_02810 [Sphingomonas sp. RS6]